MGSMPLIDLQQIRTSDRSLYMELLNSYRLYRRRVLGIEAIVNELRSLNSLLILHDQEMLGEATDLKKSLGEVRSLLGLSPDDVPATKEEIEGRDPHGL